MRSVVTILAALVLGLALSVGLVTAWHGSQPRAETTTWVELPPPEPFRIDVDPLDRGARRVDTARVVDASHAKRVTLRGSLGAGTQGYGVLLVSRRERGPVLWRTSADSDGRFEFAAVEIGPYELRVQTPGGRAANRRELTLKDDTDVTLPSAPRAYRLRVVRPRGDGTVQPVAKARVLLFRARLLVADGATDARGEVTLRAAPGTVAWTVWASGPDGPPGGVEWNGELDLADDAGPLEVRVGG